VGVEPSLLALLLRLPLNIGQLRFQPFDLRPQLFRFDIFRLQHSGLRPDAFNFRVDDGLAISLRKVLAQFIDEGSAFRRTKRLGSCQPDQRSVRWSRAAALAASEGCDACPPIAEE
jgi:hypothetical protein